MNYQLNISIPAGFNFSQIVFVTNPDGSPMDITGATVTGYLAKHPKAIFALDTTADETFFNYIPFTCYIEDGVGGVFSMNMTKAQTILLEEGQYVYSTSITDINGTNLGSFAAGPANVIFAMNPEFGTVGPQMV